MPHWWAVGGDFAHVESPSGKPAVPGDRALSRAPFRFLPAATHANGSAGRLPIRRWNGTRRGSGA